MEFNWQQLYTATTIEIRPGRSPVGRPPSDSIEQFEPQSGFALPASYKQFLNVYGPGRFDFQIASPAYPGLPQEYRLQHIHNRFTRTFHQEAALTQFDDPEILLRMFAFAWNDANDFACWDVDDVRDAVANEYAIRVVLGDGAFLHSIFAGASFAEFIEQVCYGTWWDINVGGVAPDDATLPPLIFEPAVFDDGRPPFASSG